MALDPLALLRRLDRARPRDVGAVADHVAEWWSRRGPTSRRIVGVVGALAVLLGVTTVAADGDDATVTVWVATLDADVGDPVDGVARPDLRPRDHVPFDAFGTEAPDGRLTMPVLSGQVLTARHVTPDLTSGLAPGEVTVAVRGDRLPPMRAGTVVDVLAVQTDGTGRRLAAGARVLDITAEWWWLAVPADVAAEVAAADANARLSLARRP